MEIEIAGDEGLLVRFGAQAGVPSPAVHAEVLAALAALEAARAAFVVDLVPSYACLLVRYDAALATAAEARAWAAGCLGAAGAAAPAASAAGRLLEIPVWYDPEVAPDLEELAANKGWSPDELADRHAAVEYLVYVLGFRPGFPFLGSVDAQLAAPRLERPRPRVAAGSVGIAGRQTGVYPVDGPGGWRIVGRTPLAVFDLARPDPFLFHVGDRVRFVRIDGARYRELAREGRPQL